MLGIFARTFRVATLSDCPVTSDAAQRAAADAARVRLELDALRQSRAQKAGA